MILEALAAMALVMGPSAAASCAFHDERGELIAGGQPTPQYEGSGKPWFAAGSFDYAGSRYARYGLPRSIAPDALQVAADKDGVPIFVEAGYAGAAPEVIYVMASSGECRFQPFTRE